MLRYPLPRSGLAGQQDIEFGVAGDFFDTRKAPPKDGRIIKMPISDKAQVPARQEVITALCEQVPAGELIHCVLLMKGRIA